MTYPIHQRAELARKFPHLLDEELDVQQALKDYTTSDSVATLADFTPIRVLYRRYREYVASLRWGEVETVLTRQQFGVALRQVFPDIEHDELKYRVLINGERLWGFRYMKGPGSIYLPDRERGRPTREERDGVIDDDQIV